MQFNSMKMQDGSQGQQSASRLSLQAAKRVAVRVSVSMVVMAATFTGSATDRVDSSGLKPVNTFKHWIEIGQASWYGHKFQGKKTATGESYDMNLMTCAHRSLPLGSWVKVTNLKNRKTVVVRVNDRGPALDDRIVDLSYAAAQAVGLRGVGKVRLDRMRDGDPDLAQALLAQVQMPLPFAPIVVGRF
jgi:rare lipoprotein A